MLKFFPSFLPSHIYRIAFTFHVSQKNNILNILITVPKQRCMKHENIKKYLKNIYHHISCPVTCEFTCILPSGNMEQVQAA